MKSPVQIIARLTFLLSIVLSALLKFESLRIHPRIRVSSFLKASTAPSTSSSSPPSQATEFDLFSKIKEIFQLGSFPQKSVNTPVTESYEREISEAKRFLLRAANKELSRQDSDKIVSTLMELEKLMRKQNKADDGLTGKVTLKQLNGAWRLIFTTGTVDTQKKIGGRVNFFPIKAVQSFDVENFRISNGIYINDFAVLKFFGDFEFNEKSRKLIFDFDQISVFGLKFDLPKGGAAKIGQSTGLGADSNIELVNQGKKPFFNWISADEDIATARGGGGGLALWRKVGPPDVN